MDGATKLLDGMHSFTAKQNIPGQGLSGASAAVSVTIDTVAPRINSSSIQEGATMGTGTFAEPTFESLIASFGADVVGLVTQPERDAGNKRGSTRQTGKGMANIARAATAKRSTRIAVTTSMPMKPLMGEAQEV